MGLAVRERERDVVSTQRREGREGERAVRGRERKRRAKNNEREREGENRVNKIASTL